MCLKLIQFCIKLGNLQSRSFQRIGQSGTSDPIIRLFAFLTQILLKGKIAVKAHIMVKIFIKNSEVLMHYQSLAIRFWKYKEKSENTNENLSHFCVRLILCIFQIFLLVIFPKTDGKTP